MTTRLTEAYTDALIAAGARGINLFDTAINYRHQRSERCIGAALRQLQRDEIVVCTKAGFLTPGAVPSFLKPEHVVGKMHSMDPDFLADQIDRSRANLGVDTIDVFYLHNPETQLGFPTPAEFDGRIRRAFAATGTTGGPTARSAGTAPPPGRASAREARSDLSRLAAMAWKKAGPSHHFRFIQLPFNLGMVEAFLGGSEGEKSESVLQAAARLGIAVVASATLSQGEALENMPGTVVELLPGLARTRSARFSSRALLRASRRRWWGWAGSITCSRTSAWHSVAPIPHEQYLRLYQ